MSKDQKITNDIKVPNKDWEVLRANFPQCFDKEGNFQFEKFKNNLTEKEINFSTESYGLDWLGKSYARLLASDPATTLLQADETHNSKPENANSENLLIKGDNLETLLSTSTVDKGERARSGAVFTPGNGDCRFSCVIHRNLRRIICIHRAIQLDGDCTSCSFGNVKAVDGEGHSQFRHLCHAVKTDIIDIISLCTTSIECAKRPAVHLGQAKTVVGCAVANLFAAEGAKGEF